jgi:hypothetical protein
VAELVDGARLESVYTSKGYHGFESHPLRKTYFCPVHAGHFYFKGIAMNSGALQEKEKWEAPAKNPV